MLNNILLLLAITNSSLYYATHPDMQPSEVCKSQGCIRQGLLYLSHRLDPYLVFKLSLAPIIVIMDCKFWLSGDTSHSYTASSLTLTILPFCLQFTASSSAEASYVHLGVHISSLLSYLYGII